LLVGPRRVRAVSPPVPPWWRWPRSMWAWTSPGLLGARILVATTVQGESSQEPL